MLRRRKPIHSNKGQPENLARGLNLIQVANLEAGLIRRRD